MTPHRTTGDPPSSAGTPRSATRPHTTISVALSLSMLTITAAALTAGCVTVVKGTASAPPAASRVTVIPPATPKPATVTVADLPNLLLGLPQMRDLLAAPNLERYEVTTEISEPNPKANYQPPECVSAIFTGMKSGYLASDPLGGYGQSFKELGDAISHVGDEMVVAFLDADQAKAAAAHLIDQWRSCYTFGGTRADGQPIPTFTLEPVTYTDGVSTQKRTTQGSSWGCTRYAAHKSNIVVEGQLCSYDIADRPQRLAHAILANIPQ
jgi:hypothetical protein